MVCLDACVKHPFEYPLGLGGSPSLGICISQGAVRDLVWCDASGEHPFDYPLGLGGSHSFGICFDQGVIIAYV